MYVDPALELRSARLTLRPIQPSDANALFAIQSNPAVMRYWSHPAWTDIEQAHAQVLDDVQAMRAGRLLKLGIRDQADAPLLGICTVSAFDAEAGRAEIGYHLAPQAQGRGYMDEALRCLLAYLFDARGLRRLEAEIDPRNLSSAAVLTRLGFQHEGLLRERCCVGGELCDSALYGLLSRERTPRAG